MSEKLFSEKLFYTKGVAPFKGGRRTLGRYIRNGDLGPVARIADGNRTPLLTPKQVAHANQLHDQRSSGKAR